MAKTPEDTQENEYTKDSVPPGEQQEREHAGLEDASIYGSDDYAGTLGGSVERVRSNQLPNDRENDYPFDEYYDEDDDVPSDELDPSPLS